MNKEQILSKLTTVFKNIFEDPNLILDENTSPDELKKWDSLMHIQLIVAIEKEFSISFTSLEMLEIKNAGQIIDLLDNKLSN